MRLLSSRTPLRTVLATLALTTTTAGCFGNSDVITVGSKEFTEQLVLCHITSLALRSAGKTVSEKCGLQGSDTTRAALMSGSIDMYWEYTGTAWGEHLHHTEPIEDSARLYQEVAKEDFAGHHIEWLRPAPANHSYAVAVKRTTAERLRVNTLSDYARLVRTNPSKASMWSMCVASEFVSRGDGLPGLQEAYDFWLPKSSQISFAYSDIYNAVASGKPCNFGEVGTTDGRVPAFDLKILEDDKHFFPIYNPALTVRESVYNDHPDLGKIVEPIANALTDEELIQLNGDVDVRGETPNQVAEAWLQSKGFIGR